MAVGDLWLAGSTPDRIYRSQDGGVNWGAASLGPSGQHSVQGVAVDARNGDLWLAGSVPDGIYRSQDGGVTWGALIAAPAGQTLVTGVAVDARNGDLWLAGSVPDGIYRSQDGGLTWGALIAPPAGQTNVTGVAVDARNGDLWLAGSNPDGIYRSQDGGATWGAAILGPSGQASVQDVAVDERNGDLWLAGTTPNGLYRSQDGGVNWGALIAPPAGQTAVLGVRLHNPAPLPDAEAPTVTLNSPGNVNEGTSVDLTDSVTGGTYDGALARAYQVVSGGGSVNAAGRYTAPQVAAHTNVTARITVTASGDGTTAVAGTDDTATDDVTFSVRNVPAITTDTDSVWRLATSQPATPTGGTGTRTHTPAGWTRAEPSPTATQGVWRSQRTRNYSDGAFTSATAWQTPTQTAAPTGAALALSDYDQTGLDPVFVALIRAGVSGNVRYAEAPQWTATGELLDGDLNLEGANNISRMYITPSGTAGGVPSDSVARIRFNDHPDVLNIQTFFQGIESTHRLELQTAIGGPVYQLELDGRFGAGGDHYLFIGISDATVAAAWTGLADDDLFVMALVQDAAPSLPDAVAPSLAVTAPDVDEGGTSQITATPTGGTYDGISYGFEIVSGGGSVNANGLITAPSVNADTTLTYRARPIATGDGTTAVAGSSDTGAWEQGTLTVRNVPAITTDTDSIWRLATTQPGTPAGGTGTQTHTPAGWTRGEPDPTETQGVWRSQRTRNYSDGAFTSATAWGAAVETAAATGGDTGDETALYEFNSAADFLAVFPDAVFANNQGKWRFDTGASTASPSTGPATNNASPFVHTETSASVQASVESNGIADFGSVPNLAGLMLHLRLSIQGEFGDGTEGLQIQHRASSTDAWSEAGFVHGWAYSNYELGDTITDENGVDRLCVQDGGWVDVAIAIPDTATQVRLQPRYVLAALNYAHDIALRSVQWMVSDAPALPQTGAASASAGALSAAVAGAVSVVSPQTGAATASAGALSATVAGALTTVTPQTGAATAAAGSFSAAVAGAVATVSAQMGAAAAAAGIFAATVAGALATVSPQAGAATASVGALSAAVAGSVAVTTPQAGAATASAGALSATVAGAVAVVSPQAGAATATSGALSATVAGSVGVVAQVLALSDITVPAGEVALVRMLVEANISGVDLFDAPDDVIAGDADLADDLSIDQVERQTAGLPLRLRKTGAGEFRDYFGSTALYPAAKLYIRVSATAQLEFTHSSSGGGFSNWAYADSSLSALFTDIATGDRFGVLITNTAPAAPQTGAASASAGALSATVAGAVTVVSPQAGAATASAGALSATVAGAVSVVTPQAGAASASAGALSATVAGAVATVSPQAGAASASAGALSATVMGAVAVVTPQTGAATAASGAITASVAGALATVSPQTGAATAISGALSATVAGEVGVVPGQLLALPDYDTTGLDVVFAALIRAGDSGDIILALAPQWTAVGSLLDGDLGINDGDGISRIFVVSGGGQGTPTDSLARIRFNDHPDPLDLLAFFQGIESTHRLELQTAPGGPVYSFALAGRYGSGGGGGSGGGAWIYIGVPGAAVADAWTGLSDDDLFVMALVRDTPPVAGAASASAGALSATVAGAVSVVTPQAGAATASAGALSAAVAGAVATVSPQTGAATASAGALSAAVAGAVAVVTPQTGSASASAGALSAAVAGAVSTVSRQAGAATAIAGALSATVAGAVGTAPVTPPVLTTDTDSIWRLAATQPGTPAGGTGTQTHTPTGWTRNQPTPTETQGVWRSQRTRSYSDGSFTSATAWQTPTQTAAPTVAVPAITTDTDSVWRLATSQPATPTGGTGTRTHTPAGWTRAEPSPTATEGVWRSQRTRTFSGGTFTSATSWAAPTETAAATGVVPPVIPNISLSAAEQAILHDQDRYIYTRVMVGATNLADYFRRATWQETLDGGAPGLTVELSQRDADGADVTPLLSATLSLGARLVLSTATLAAPGNPSAGDWHIVFDAVIDDLDWTGSRIVAQCRARHMATVADRWVEEPTIYGEDAGQPLHTTIRAVLADWTTGVTLEVPVAPGFRVLTYEQKRATVLQAITALADLAGWVIRQTLQNGAFHLTLLEPDRGRADADWVLASVASYRTIGRVSASVDQVRNAIEVEWVDEDGETQTAERTSSTSISAIGRRWLRHNASGQIDTDAEATRLADQILADLSQPDVEIDLALRYFWPVQLGDVWAVPSDAWHWNASQRLAVVGIRHAISETGDETTVTLRGTPSGARGRWLFRSDPVIVRLPVAVTIDDGRANPVIRLIYSAGVRYLRIDIPAPPLALAGVAFDTSEAGLFGTAPANVAVAVADGTYAKVFDELDDEGGEVSYIVGTDVAEDSAGVEVIEDPLAPNTIRGEYRVSARATPGPRDPTYLVWAGQLGGEGAGGGGGGGIEHDGPPVRINLGLLRVWAIHNVRTTLPDSFVVWRLDHADVWAIAGGETTAPDTAGDFEDEDGNLATRVIIQTITDAAGFVTGFNVFVVTPGWGSQPMDIAFAAVTGTGALDDPYVYYDITTFAIARGAPLSEAVLMVSAPPDNATAGIQGRLAGTAVEETP